MTVVFLTGRVQAGGQEWLAFRVLPCEMVLGYQTYGQKDVMSV